MLEAVDLSCARGDRILFSRLTLAIKPHEALVVLGNNGAGKTSLLRMLCGLLPPHHGTIKWEGTDIGTQRERFASLVSYIGHLNGLKGDLTPTENLRTLAQLGGHDSSEPAIDQALGAAGLDHRAMALPTRALSQGQQRRVALARLWLPTRRLWILDEPLAALDEAGTRLLTQRLKEHLSSGGMVVMATHQEVGLDAGAMRQLRLAG